MHDCRKVEGGLVDLLFGEVGEGERLRLMSEVEACSGCFEEYRNMSGALNLFDEAAEASRPAEEFWAEHHYALQRNIKRATAAATTTARSVPFWKRIFSIRLPVPLPAAAAVLAVLTLAFYLALRPGKGEQAAVAPVQTHTIAAQPQVVEVPVYRERVVTRTVYVEKARGKSEGSRDAGARREARQLAGRGTEGDSGNRGLFTRANLAEYQPPDEMQIRVIKRNNSDEK